VRGRQTQFSERCCGDYRKFKDLPSENGKPVGKYVTWDPKTGVVSLKSRGQPLQKTGAPMVFKQ